MFYWPALEQQVRVEGGVAPVDPVEADAYFATRARLSQLGAWASEQSQPLETRKQLEDRLEALEAQYAHAPVPRPPHWSGFRLVPDRIEFWKSRPNRLHDRWLYQKDQDGWRHGLLSP